MSTVNLLQIIAGFIFAFAYVPLIYRMKKNQSSEDVSLGFLFMISVALIMSCIYSFDKFFSKQYASVDFWSNEITPLVITNVVNLVMVAAAGCVAVKLRR